MLPIQPKGPPSVKNSPGTPSKITKAEKEIEKRIDKARMDFSNHIQETPRLYRKFIFHKISPANLRKLPDEHVYLDDNDKTYLQGNKPSMVAMELIIHIDDYLKNNDLGEPTRAKFLSCRNALLDAVELEDKLETSKKREDDLVQSLKANIKKLKNNEIPEALILGGTLGHAFVYTLKLDPKNQDKFIFTIIDTDHESAPRKNRVGAHTIAESSFDNLDEATLLECARPILALQHIAGFHGGRVEKRFEQAFGSSVRQDKEMAFNRQMAGICSSKSLTVWLHHRIGKEEGSQEYREFKLFVFNKYKSDLENGFQLTIPKTYEKSRKIFGKGKEKVVIGPDPGKINVTFGTKVDAELSADLDKKIASEKKKLNKE